MPESTSQINIERLASELKARRGKLGLRIVAKEITGKFGEVSASTLSRVEQGGIPDLHTFLRLCRWLGISADEFTSATELSRLADKDKQLGTPEMIEAHFRAEKVLPPQTIDALANMIRQAYQWADSQGTGAKQIK